MCDGHLESLELYVAQLPSRDRPRGQIWEWGLADLVGVAAVLGWLPRRASLRGRGKIGDLVAVVKELRNLVHPSRHVYQYPNVRLQAGHYHDAYAIVSAATAQLESLLRQPRQSRVWPIGRHR